MKGVRLGLAICVIGGVMLFGTERRSRAGIAVESDQQELVVRLESPNTPSIPSTPAPVASVDPKDDPQLLASLGLKTPATPVDRQVSSCPDQMVEVEGDFCPNLEQKCLRWLDPETRMRCAEFAPTGACQGKTVHKRFCMDRFEYPNRPGEKPVVMKTWYEAKSTCEGQGKRLCGESEWTLACEGQERLPYPYGHARSADACNIDKPYLLPDEKAIANPQTRDAEVARLDQREASGVRESCVSPYGIHDMTGNVDEWVLNESGHPYQSGLKGGYWGPVRTRCRPMTTAHNEDFSFYQIGFRCCEDVPGAAKTAKTTPPATNRNAKGTEAPPSAKAKAPAATPAPATTAVVGS